ncbi:unnamed protein product [Amoebophrya sp. A120]|nr:unnamed protein product [Amoebophrya sp. A120]|eukprot:GSA120T00009278001.1
MGFLSDVFSHHLHYSAEPRLISFSGAGTAHTTSDVVGAELPIPQSSRPKIQHHHPHHHPLARTSSHDLRHSRGNSTTQTPTSFILRCWYSFRGKQEGQECQDTRSRFENAEFVDMLPHDDESKCAVHSGGVYYIVNNLTPGTAKGNWFPSAPNDTLEFPTENWHKCCVPKDDDGTGQMICEKARLVERESVKRMYDGYCGLKTCVGYKDRCLEEAQVSEYSEHGDVYRKECPKNCPNTCLKTYMTRKCIYTGTEPKEGYEGFPTPLDPVSKEYLGYKVIDLGMMKDEVTKLEPEVK